MELRPEVQRFAELMELTLLMHDNKEHWSGITIPQLFINLVVEVAELAEAINNYDFTAITNEAVDVANYAMMIADNAGT